MPAPLLFFRTHDDSISLVNTDLGAYSTAQKNLLDKSIEMFRSEGLRNELSHNLYMLLRWCVGDYLGVMRRSKRIEFVKLIKYLVFVSNNSNQLGRYRYKMRIETLFSVVKLLANMLRLRAEKIGKTMRGRATSEVETGA